MRARLAAQDNGLINRDQRFESAARYQFHCSLVVEHPAVNREIEGPNPSDGASAPVNQRQISGLLNRPIRVRISAGAPTYLPWLEGWSNRRTSAKRS